GHVEVGLEEAVGVREQAVDVAAERVAAVVREQAVDDATVLTCYDWHGTYGHPDHVKVHQVAHRAGELLAAAGDRVRVLDATSNRDAMARMISAARESGADFGGPERDEAGEFDPNAGADDGNPFGEPEEVLTLCVDVTDWIDRKRESIAAHGSQVTDSSFFLSMPDEIFALAFGQEWFIEPDRTPPHRTGWIFDDG
ncbi:MAG: GlcNAc-PI de-N-acetylase, partial [Actinomycetota bacterium]